MLALLQSHLAAVYEDTTTMVARYLQILAGMERLEYVVVYWILIKEM